MSTGAVIAVAVAVLVVAAIAAALVMQRGGGASPGLRRRFGPEYERTLARHDGDGKATRRELGERVKRYGGLELRPLSGQARERYEANWAALQSRFVDEPGPAVNEADHLLAGLAAERGFPGPDSPEHFDALSVHHPYHVQGYRQAHLLAEHGPAGSRATEDLRQALLGARGLFDELLGGARPSIRKAAPEPSPRAEPSAGEESVTTRQNPDIPDIIDSGHDERRNPLAHRFATLTGGRRHQSGDEDL